MTRWTAKDIPDQTGRVAIVTGANSGLGYVTAQELARRGARVVLASRDQARGAAAVTRLHAAVPGADVVLRPLDLSDLSSVRTFADGIQADHPAVDLLVNNAGVMAIPRRTSVDGFELQLATNHLGHFALTGLLLPMMANREHARVVTVSSFVHRMGTIDLDDLQHERSYSRWRAYADSKLANLLFAFELQRRLTAVDAALISVAAHPGFAATNLVRAGADGNPTKERIRTAAVRLVAQSEAQGALPQLYAATSPGVRGGEYFGPRGPGEQRGSPKRVDSSSASKQTATAARLWSASEVLTDVRFDRAGLDGT